MARFVNAYPTRYKMLEQFATVAERRLRDILDPLNLELHQVSARAKSSSSAIAKIRRKGYGNPWRQLTDQVGVRVIVYYEPDVDRAVQALAGALEVDPSRSVDKRRDLQVRQFGYRSVHLVARFRNRSSFAVPVPVRNIWFEVQVRSILEHAWAEIEHEVCYKSGIAFPDGLLRRFGAMAGSLEILDAQFTALRTERERLVTELRDRYAAGHDMDVQLDAARLTAALEVLRARGPGWRPTGTGRTELPVGSDAACVEALKAAGIRTARSLKEALGQPRCRRRVAAFAGAISAAAQDVSHYALCVIVVGLRKESLLLRFPDLVQDPLLRAVFPRLAAV